MSSYFIFWNTFGCFGEQFWVMVWGIFSQEMPKLNDDEMELMFLCCVGSLCCFSSLLWPGIISYTSNLFLIWICGTNRMSVNRILDVSKLMHLDQKVAGLWNVVGRETEICLNGWEILDGPFNRRVILTLSDDTVRLCLVQGQARPGTSWPDPCVGQLVTACLHLWRGELTMPNTSLLLTW